MSVDINAIKGKINELLDKYPIVNDPLIKLSEKAKLDKAYIFVAIIFLPLFVAFFMGWGNFIIDLIGFVYPVYASIKSIQTSDNESHTQWLTYWLIFGMFKVVEGIADAIISLIPFFFPAKVIFLIWCYYPSFKGAQVIYDAVLKPYVVPLIIPAKSD